MASSSERVAILGATGQLGQDLVKAAGRLGIEAVPLGHERVEITDAASVKAALEAVRPTVVVNSAAFHQVDRCEEDPAAAFAANATGALNVARASKALGARVVYVSTDYVFDGTRKPRAGRLRAPS